MEYDELPDWRRTARPITHRVIAPKRCSAPLDLAQASESAKEAQPVKCRQAVPASILPGFPAVLRSKPRFVAAPKAIPFSGQWCPVQQTQPPRWPGLPPARSTTLQTSKATCASGWGSWQPEAVAAALKGVLGNTCKGFSLSAGSDGAPHGYSTPRNTTENHVSNDPLSKQILELIEIKMPWPSSLSQPRSTSEWVHGSSVNATTIDARRTQAILPMRSPFCAASSGFVVPSPPRQAAFQRGLEVASLEMQVAAGLACHSIASAGHHSIAQGRLSTGFASSTGPLASEGADAMHLEMQSACVENKTSPRSAASAGLTPHCTSATQEPHLIPLRGTPSDGVLNVTEQELQIVPVKDSPTKPPCPGTGYSAFSFADLEPLVIPVNDFCLATADDLPHCSAPPLAMLAEPEVAPEESRPSPEEPQRWGVEETSGNSSTGSRKRKRTFHTEVLPSSAIEETALASAAHPEFEDAACEAADAEDSVCEARSDPYLASDPYLT